MNKIVNGADIKCNILRVLKNMSQTQVSLPVTPILAQAGIQLLLEPIQETDSILI